MDSILHICSEEAWAQAEKQGRYEADSLESEGFMHCSLPDQLLASANRHFKGKSNLIVLVIDPKRVETDLKWELAKDGDTYPHIYGVLKTSAVLSVKSLPIDSDGEFLMPNV